VTLRRSRTQPDLLANRRPGISPGRRFALALGLALVLLGSAGVASADPGSGPMVTATVYAAGGGTSSTSVSSSELLADPQKCPAYSQSRMTEYSSSGPTTIGLPGNSGSGTGTWSMSTIVQCLQDPVSPGDVTGITVLSGDGSPEVGPGSQLTPADLASPSDFQSNTDSPTISDRGSSFEYNRPWRGQGDLDLNDQVSTAAPISIEVFEGPPLTVTATASSSSPAAGASVSFSAAVSGNQGSALHYHWSFGDNLPDSQEATPSVTYTDAASYTVTLQVSDDNGGAGGTTVPITVTGSSAATPPPTASTPGASTGPKGTGTNPNGGTHGTTGGNGKGAGTTPSNGNGNTGKHRTGTPSPTSSHTQTPSRSGAASSSGSPGSSATTSPPPTSSPSTANSPATRSSPAHRTHRAAHRAPTHHRPVTTTGATGQLVTGRLIADVTPRAPGASPLVRRSPGSAAAAVAARRQTTASPLGAIAGGLAILLLLGLGAGRELRGPGWWRTVRLSG